MFGFFYDDFFQSVLRFDYRPKKHSLLQLNSVEQSSVSSSPSSFSSLEEIMDRAYERYDVELRRVQMLYSKSGTRLKLVDKLPHNKNLTLNQV